MNGQIALFGHAAGFAGIIVESFSFPGALHPAFVHLKSDAVRTLFNNALGIDPGIDTENKGLL
jgi:hypothetical protein